MNKFNYIPYFSIIIPVKKNPNIIFIIKCLNSIRKQIYKNNEIIFVTDIETSKIIRPLLKFGTKEYIKIGNWTKSQARNKGASLAKGLYLLHIDIDYQLPPSILSLAYAEIQNNKTKAIILHEKIASSKNIWQQARQFEREIVVDDLVLSSPQLIQKKLFHEIDGFDERVDALDDWTMSLKLKKHLIVPHRLPPITIVHEPTNLFSVWKNRYNKGRYYPLLKQLYKEIPQTDFVPRVSYYFSKLPKFISKPHITFAFFILKIADTIPFLLGSLNPVITTLEDIYQKKSVADYFDNENIASNTVQYKHFIEQKSLLSLLNNKKGSILELGAGTGRITNILTKKGYNVIPTDISKAMLSHLKNKKHLPQSIFIRSKTLPFKNRQYHHTIAIRVIWHILNKKHRDTFFNEAARTSKKSVIMDFTIDKKYSKSLIRFLLKTIKPDFFTQTYYFPIHEIHKLAKSNQLKVESIIPLEILPPLILNIIPIILAKKLFPFWRKLELAFQLIIPPGRLLIKFTHI